MAERLPEFIDPLSLAKKRAEMRGSVSLATMPRLVESVMAAEGDAEVVLRFHREGGVPTIEGGVNAVLTLQCQSCMQAMAWPVASRFKLGVVATLEEADVLPESHEPLLLDESPQVRLSDIVEDELLLALPIIPRHERCDGEDERASRQSGRTNPFGVLAALKKD